MFFNLARLCLRKDIAMLGFLHKCNLSDAHRYILELFPQWRQRSDSHTKQLWHIAASHSGELFQKELLNRSISYLVEVYNALPQWVVNARSVTDFQSCLTKVARNLAEAKHPKWQTFLSAREWDSQDKDEWKSFFMFECIIVLS